MLGPVRDCIIFLYDVVASLSDDLPVKRSLRMEVEELIVISGLHVMLVIFLIAARCYYANAGLFTSE